MNLLYVPLALICLVAGGLAYCVYAGVPLDRIASDVTACFQPLMNAWNTLPPMAQGIITLGIPTLFTLFFAWTKTRAMQQYKNTQIQSSEEINKLARESIDSKNQVTQITEQRDSIQQKYNDLASSNADITALSGKLEQSKANFDRLQQDYNTMERTLQNTINDLKLKEKIVVK